VIFPFPGPAAPAIPDSPVDLAGRLEVVKRSRLEEWSTIASMKVTFTMESGQRLPVDVMIVPQINSNHTLCSFSLLLRNLAKESEGYQRSQMIKNCCQHILRELIPLEVDNKITMPGVQSALFASNLGTIVSIEILGIVD
jgi:hypothetical protein